MVNLPEIFLQLGGHNERENGRGGRKTEGRSDRQTDGGRERRKERITLPVEGLQPAQQLLGVQRPAALLFAKDCCSTLTNVYTNQNISLTSVKLKSNHANHREKHSNLLSLLILKTLNTLEVEQKSSCQQTNNNKDSHTISHQQLPGKKINDRSWPAGTDRQQRKLTSEHNCKSVANER